VTAYPSDNINFANRLASLSFLKALVFLECCAFNDPERHLSGDTHETYQQLVKALRAMACLGAFREQKQPSPSGWNPWSTQQQNYMKRESRLPL
jgi:hypothetical protein